MRSIGVFALLLALASAPLPVAAQAAQFDQAIRASAALAGPSAPGLSLPTFDADAAIKAQKRDQRSLGVTLMIIGGGAVVVGALVGGGGGAVVVVGGVACAGYGFYLYQEK